MIIQIGLAVSPYAKSSLGYQGNFGISMGCAIAAMFWAMFLKDSRMMRPAEVIQKGAETEEGTVAEEKGCCKISTLATMFDPRNIKRAFTVTFKKRAYNIRPYLLIMASVYVLYHFMISGRDSTFYLYCREVKHGSEVLYLHAGFIK